MADELGVSTILLGVAVGVAGNAASATLWSTRHLLSIGQDPRRKALRGDWQGSFSQWVASGTATIYTLKLTLKSGRKRVKGTGSYLDGGSEIPVVLVGGFHQNDVVTLEYRNADGAAIQHGLLILRLLNDPSKLEGGFAGVGFSPNAIVTGTVDLSKVVAHG